MQSFPPPLTLRWPHVPCFDEDVLQLVFLGGDFTDKYQVLPASESCLVSRGGEPCIAVVVFVFDAFPGTSELARTTGWDYLRRPPGDIITGQKSGK